MRVRECPRFMFFCLRCLSPPPSLHPPSPLIQPPISSLQGAWWRGGGQDHVSRKINCSFHNSREIKSIFHVSRKQMAFFYYLTRTYVTYDIWKLRPRKALLDIFTIRSLLPLHAAKRIPSTEEHEEGWLSCHGHAILLITVENNRKHNQNHGSRHFSHFTDNYFGKSRFTASNEITIHEKKQAISHFMRKKIGHSRITKIPFTILFKGKVAQMHHTKGKLHLLLRRPN